MRRHALFVALIAGTVGVFAPTISAQNTPPSPSPARTPVSPSPSTQAPPSVTPNSTSNASQSAERSLSDFQLATWVIVENDLPIRVSMMAQNQAQSAEVKQFAQQIVRDHQQLNARLLRLLRNNTSSEQAVNQDSNVDINGLLDELVGRLQARSETTPRQQLPAGSPSSALVAPTDPDRAEPRPVDDAPLDARASAPAASNTAEADAHDEDRSARDRDDPRRERQEVRESRRERLQERFDRLGIRREPADRAAVRDLVRDALPAIRANLPEILEVLDDAADDSTSDATGLAFIQLQREIVQDQARRAIEEIQRTPQAIDQAYLGYTIAAHERLLSTMQVNKKYGSTELRTEIEQLVPTLHEHIQIARRLMKSP